MRQSPARTAKREGDSNRSQAQPKDCAPCSDESQSRNNVPAPASVARRTPSLSLLQTSPLRPREAASSNRKIANLEDHGHDRTTKQAERFDSAQIPNLATSSTIPTSAASCHKIATRQRLRQDGLYVPLSAPGKPAGSRE